MRRNCREREIFLGQKSEVGSKYGRVDGGHLGRQSLKEFFESDQPHSLSGSVIEEPLPETAGSIPRALVGSRNDQHQLVACLQVEVAHVPKELVVGIERILGERPFRDLAVEPWSVHLLQFESMSFISST